MSFKNEHAPRGSTRIIGVFFPVRQLMQADSLVTPRPALHFPFGHPLQPPSVGTASTSEYVPLVQLPHPSVKLLAAVVSPKVPLGQD